jgi:CDP-paratose 2-epimerase
MIGEILGKKPEVLMEADRPGDMRYFICDTSAARKFGFNPKVKPREGIEKLIRWIEANKSVFEIK